jgi:hypothetical protein
MSKKIKITHQDFIIIQNIFFNHLLKNPEDTQALILMQNIITQCLDKK